MRVCPELTHRSRVPRSGHYFCDTRLLCNTNSATISVAPDGSPTAGDISSGRRRLYRRHLCYVYWQVSRCRPIGSRKCDAGLAEGLHQAMTVFSQRTLLLMLSWYKENLSAISIICNCVWCFTLFPRRRDLYVCGISVVCETESTILLGTIYKKIHLELNSIQVWL